MTKEELQNIADTYGLYTEEDVKNRLSCELLAIGARNEELEAENAELEKELAITEHDREHNNYELTEVYKRVEALEKENEELKAEKEANENGVKKYAEFYFQINDKLTKAKELLNEFIKWADWQGNSKCPSFKRIKDKAEAFMKE